MENIEVTKIDSNNFIIKGRLDIINAPILAEELENREYNDKDLVLDFSDVLYISSSGLRVLLIEQKKMKDNNKVVILNVSEPVREIFELTGFYDMLTFRKSE